MKFFSPNWKLINKAIAENDLIKLRQEQEELKKKIQSKISAAYIQKKQQEEINKVLLLKSLPTESLVFYTGRSKEIPFGAEGKKVKDGRKRMDVSFNGKRWLVYYTNLKIKQVTTDEITSNKVQQRIENLFNNH